MRDNFEVDATSAEILIGISNEDKLKLFTNLLSEEGYLVRSLVSGEEIVQSILKCSPDLILLEAGIHSVDMYKTCKQLKSKKVNKDFFLLQCFVLSSAHR